MSALYRIALLLIAAVGGDEVGVRKIATPRRSRRMRRKDQDAEPLRWPVHVSTFFHVFGGLFSSLSFSNSMKNGIKEKDESAIGIKLVFEELVSKGLAVELFSVPPNAASRNNDVGLKEYSSSSSYDALERKIGRPKMFPGCLVKIGSHPERC